jgi:CDP-6-deoxy-D-xylo-4-hexulose-3-dehydrase
MSDNAAQLRQKIVELVGQYADLEMAPRPFVAGQSAVPPSGKVIGAGELQMMTEAVLDGWLTTGRFNEAFEKRLARYLGRRCVVTTNSGSSAILQFGAVPVFVDIELPTYNINPALIEAAITPKTKAIMLAHTLGNPFDLGVVRALCDKYGLWLIEDCCDALGTTYDGRMVGTFGDIGTLSFYPAHHITMGEGGAVFTNSPLLKRIVESFRDWGRDCYCAPGEDNTCKQRFCQCLGDLPEGYDHKYTYSHLGYNLKITDMQAACALAQMDRLEGFIEARKRNFRWLSERLAGCQEFLILPQATEGSDPSWFGYPITLRDGCGVSRLELLKYLDARKVGTRLLFAGNLTRQPYMRNQTYRVSGQLTVTDKVMHDTFWIGLWPGLGEQHLEHAARCIEAFLQGRA